MTSTDIKYEDGKHIWYVNGAYRGDDAIGRLMHDFSCNEASNMSYQLMSERTKYLKENEKGVQEMCRISEEIREEGIKEGRLKEKEEMARKLFLKGFATDEIAELVEQDVKEVKKWLILENH